MEKTRFETELKEAVLTYEEGQAYATINGEKRRIRSPVPLNGNNIGEKGIACLVMEGTDAGGTDDRVVAVLFDDLQREGKDWIGTDPMLMEQVVGHFLEHHQMEKMASGYKSVIREKGSGPFRPDFILDDVCIIEIRLPPVGMADGCGSYAQLMPMAGFFERSIQGFRESAGALGQIQRIIFLILLPCKGDSSLRPVFHNRIRQALQEISLHGIKVEFWSAEMGISLGGVSLLSYQEITALPLCE